MAIIEWGVSKFDTCWSGGHCMNFRSRGGGLLEWACFASCKSVVNAIVSFFILGQKSWVGLGVSLLQLSSVIEHIVVILSSVTFFLKILQCINFCCLQVFLASLTSLFNHHYFLRRWLNSLEKLHSSPPFLMSCQSNNQATYLLSNNLFFHWRCFGQTIPFGNFTLRNSSSTRGRICRTIRLFWYWSL